MKKSNLIWIIPVTLLIIIALGLTTVNLFSEQIALPKTKYIEAPTFGYLKCDPIESQSYTKTFGAEQVTISCSKDSKGNTLLGMNNGCMITLTAPDKTTAFRRTYAYKEYRNGILSKEQEVAGGLFGGGILGYNGEQETITLTGKDYILIAYGGALFGDLKAEGQSYTVQGDPFTLYNYNDLSSKHGQPLSNSRVGNCFLENEYFKGMQIKYNSPEIDELEDQELDYENLNKPYGTYTYFKGFTPVPNFDAKVETYKGDQVYCMDNALYKILQINSGGFFYNIVNYEKSGFIKEVPCCNGDEKPAYICDNHEWIKQEEFECDISKGKFCPKSTYQPFGEKGYKRFNCQDNECVADIIEVECNDENDCKDGEVCIRQDNPNKNYCAEGGSAGLTPPPPPLFCEAVYSIKGMTILPNLSKQCVSFSTPIRIGMALIGAILIFAFAFTRLPFKKKQKKTKLIVAILLSAIFGFLIWYYWWILLISLLAIIIGWLFLKKVGI